MLVDNVLVIYYCKSCKRKQTSKVNEGPVLELEELREYLNHFAPCICGKKAVLEYAKFRTVENKFGDSRFGSWNCPNHMWFSYYPTILRRASKRTLTLTTVSKAELEHYEEIVSAGYPWKCPICGTKMVYADERNHYGYFAD